VAPRKIQFVNLGLEPWEVIDMDLEIETVEEGKRYKPVAQYVIEREDGDYWKEWLQTHCIELNVMTARGARPRLYTPCLSRSL
jgi:hypothetical protein